MKAPKHRWVSDLGMFAIDRPIFGIKPTATRPGAKPSCVWRTAACSDCFNNKFYGMYAEDMANRDVENEISWQSITGEALHGALARKHTRQTGRFRLMTRGEAARDPSDVSKIRSICNANPDMLVWMPTRAWRSRVMRPLLEALRDECPNLRLQASTDTGTTAEEQASLERDGWSTMFFGDDDRTTTPAGTPMFQCPKTWEHEKGACATTCDDGCFSKKPTHVHLKKH